MKYLIHDHYAGQQSLIDTLPSGYTALDYEHEDTPGIIEALGDGVNIAARLESIAPPGRICIPEAIHRL